MAKADEGNEHSQLLLSRVRLAALSIAAHGTTYDQSDFLSVPEQLSALHEYSFGTPARDGTLSGRALAAMIKNGLPLSHPLVLEMVCSDVPAERHAVALAIDPANDVGRSLLTRLYNDSIGWVREVARNKLAAYDVAPWTGLFSKDPFEGADERTRAAVQHVIDTLSIQDYEKAERAAQESLGPSLAALDDERLVDLCATVVDGRWLQRPSTPTVLRACRDRALLGHACERASHRWLTNWNTIARCFEPIDSVSLASRAPMQLAMFRALAQAHAHPDHRDKPPRWPWTTGIVEGDPWRHQAAPWIDAVRELWSIEPARRFVQAVARCIDPEFVDAPQREECVTRWIEGQLGSWEAFADDDGSVEKMVRPMQRAKARAFAQRATQSANKSARTWGLWASLSSLWDPEDEPRDALSERYFSDATNRELALSEPDLAGAFAAPLRRALVDGELRSWLVIEALARTVLRDSDLDVLVKLEIVRSVRRDERHPKPRWSAAERHAFERHRRAEFESSIADAARGAPCLLLSVVPARREWTDEDARFVEDVFNWARSRDEVRDMIGVYLLAAALIGCDDDRHVDLAQRLLDDDLFDRPTVLSLGLRALVTKAAPAGRSANADASSKRDARDREDEGWGDDD